MRLTTCSRANTVARGTLDERQRLDLGHPRVEEVAVAAVLDQHSLAADVLDAVQAAARRHVVAGLGLVGGLPWCRLGAHEEQEHDDHE
jgi:hypothetical protein